MTTLAVDVAIIGAGTSGCFVASLLDEAGLDCTLVEKSRGLGGRCSRRRIDQEFSIDMGAHEFSMAKLENPSLQEKVSSWIQAGYLSSWSRSSSCFDTPNDTEITETLCGTPSMNSWHKNIAGHINCVTDCKVHSLKKEAGRWQLLDESGQLISTTSKVVITCPQEQAIELLQRAEGLSDYRAISAKSLAQYVCAIGFTQPLRLNADSYRGGHGILDSAISENSKPGRVNSNPQQEVWILHSTHEWAQQQAHKDHPQAAMALVDAFCQYFGINAQPRMLASHYWRLARHQTSNKQQSSYVWHEALQLGCCGDWFGSGDINGALNSALELSQKIIHSENEV